MVKIILEVSNLLACSEAADYLKVSRPTIYTMIERGELHPFVFSNNSYFYREEVERLKAFRAKQKEAEKSEHK